MSEAPAGTTAYAELAAEIVSAYVGNNHVAMPDIPLLIRSVHDTLSGLNAPAPAETREEPLKPAVPIKKSVTEEYIISLEDGRKFKSMRRYLAGLGMSPEQYRAKWGLPPDYPMVAPAYAAKRSELARASGLGRKAVEAVPPVAEAPEPVEEPALPLEPEAAPVAARPKRNRKAA